MGTKPTTDRRGRVLMVAAAFPPTGGSGVQRSAKFAKYLPAFGWTPIVWTTDRTDGLPEDPTLLDELPHEVVIHRSSRGLSARRWRRRVRELTRGATSLARAARAVDWRLERWIAGRAWPDDHAAWSRAGVEPLARRIEQEAVDVIYSTYSPVSNHTLAMAVAKRTGRPWVADFRDLWTDDYRYAPRSARRWYADRELEQQILESADIVIGVTPRQTRILAQRVPDRAHKFVTITNGFDPEDFEPAAATGQSGGRFVLAYVGRLDRYRLNEELLEGFRRFAREPDGRADRFVFRVVGPASAEAQSRVGATGLPCEFVPPACHAEAVRQMRTADALLVSVDDTGPNADSVISAKTFEYLAAGRPILCIGPRDGECERVVLACHAGIAVAFDAEVIADALRTLCSDRAVGTAPAGCTSERLDRYSRVTLTRRLAGLLDRLSGREPRRDTPARVLEAAVVA